MVRDSEGARGVVSGSRGDTGLVVTTSAEAGSRRTGAYRPALDGLRAVAVAVVFAYGFVFVLRSQPPTCASHNEHPLLRGVHVTGSRPALATRHPAVTATEDGREDAVRYLAILAKEARDAAAS